ncbi:uncharacterized protein KRP23_11319 [Phytophthora ramorum]|uniref:uncharacterized protein n=1 Tax=Phytophthora ramorum TaxID=164328 RepID=UPI003098D438|nr:hypothetical protein KRP23_11319 [Phytophthora ramorum]
MTAGGHYALTPSRAGSATEANAYKYALQDNAAEARIGVQSTVCLEKCLACKLLPPTARFSANFTVRAQMRWEASPSRARLGAGKAPHRRRASEGVERAGGGEPGNRTTCGALPNWYVAGSDWLAGVYMDHPLSVSDRERPD